MNILICAASSGEMQIIKKNIKNLKIPNLSISFLTTGIGNYETIFSLTKYFLTTEKETIDLVVNIGVSGYIGTKFSLAQVARIIPVSTEKENIVPIPVTLAPLVSCQCGETAIYSKLLDEEDYIVDMESFATDFVCQKFQLPRIILKVPVDLVGDETRNFDRDYALELLEKNINWKEILEKIMQIKTK